MADDDKKDSGAAPATVDETAPTLFGHPLDMFVRGGTHTSGHDRMMAERVADAERRRDVAAKERQLAAVPIEDGGAQMFTNNMALNPQAEAASVLLKYCTPRGEVKHANGDEIYCVAEVLMMGGGDLAVQLVCLRCKERGVHQGECQLLVRQSNRKWHLDTRGWDGSSASFPHKAGQPFMFDGKPYRSAGVICDSERFSCPNCSWSARIDGNRVIPEQ